MSRPFRCLLQSLVGHMVLGCFLLVGVGAVLAQADSGTLEKEITCVELQMHPDPTGAWTELVLTRGYPMVALGEPAIPSLRVSVKLPPGSDVAAVRLMVLDQEWLALPRPVKPYAGEQASTQSAPPTVAPDPRAYRSDDLFPAEPVRLVTVTERSGGSRYAVVQVNPLQYRAAGDRLLWIRRARLLVDLRPGSGVESGLARKRPVLPDGGAVGPPRDPSGHLLLLEPGFVPTETPSVEGTPIEYVIISPPDAEMVSEWQRLADWKTSCGHPAIVVTTDWIDEHYANGCDLLERMRFFLRDAYIHWGLKAALIGADPELVPVRYARSWGLNRVGTDIACDYYLACLEGSWDADRDGIFGESDYGIEGADTLLYESDNVDFTPEIQVGRVTAHFAEEVSDYLEKYFTYVQSPPANGYLDRDLLLGEVLFDAQWSRFGRDGEPDCNAEECHSDPTCRLHQGAPVCARTDGATYCFRIEDVIEEETDVPHELVFLLERAEYWATHEPVHQSEILGADRTIEYLNDGYHLIHHVGHADRDRWAVGGARVGDARLLIPDLDRLTNGDQDCYFIVYGVNCSSAAIDYDSFAEVMLMQAGQGAVAYLGATNADFPTTADRFAQDFYYYLFEEPGGTLGDGHFLSMATNALAPDRVHGDGTQRFLLFTQVLLGEPAMPVWWATPTEMQVAFDAEVSLGTGSLTVSVTSDGGDVAGARVCVHKDEEVYAIVQTSATGVAAVPFMPKTTGEFSVVVTSPHHYPMSESGQVVAATADVALVVEALEIVDDGSLGSCGNGNGQIEVGETIRLSLTIRNEGQAGAEDIQAGLELAAGVPAGALEIVDSTATFGTLAAGSAATDSEAFLLQIACRPGSVHFGDGTLFRVPLDLTLRSGESEWETDFSLEVARAELDVSPNVSAESSRLSSLLLWLGVRSEGRGTASHLVGSLISQTPGYVQVSGSGEIELRDIAPGDTALAGPFELDVSNSSHARLLFSVIDTFQTPPDTLHQRQIDLRGPSAPGDLVATGLPEAVELRWSESLDPSYGEIHGYLVYRAEAESEVFEPVLDGILEDHRYLNDSGLGHLTQYHYWVQAVDAAGNLGDSSEVVSVYTAPGMASGWPNRFKVSVPCSPLVCELDGRWSTKREIVLGGEAIYAFHGNGSEVVDGDEVASTLGPFSADGASFWGKAATGDIDGDGWIEVLAVSKASNELICWPPWGGTPKWRVSLPGPRSWFSPTLADFDGNDGGLMEVIFCAGKYSDAGIYVFNHDGSPMISGTNGLLLDLDGIDLYHSPAVGDVDGDGGLEVVMSTRSNRAEQGAIWVVKPDGSSLPGFEDGLAFADLGLTQQTTGSPVLFDADSDGRDEIFVITPWRLWCIDDNGALLWYSTFTAGFDMSTARGMLPEPAMGDIDGDELVDIAVVDEGQKLWAWNAVTGDTLSGFPIDLADVVGTQYGSCILANMDADELPEIVFGDNEKHVHAYKHDGTTARGFPIFFGGSFVQQSLAAWDVDLDGNQNLIVQAEDVLQIAVFDLQGAVFDSLNSWRTNPWPMRYRDNRNTGRYTADPPVGIQVSLGRPEVDAQGWVTLRWVCGERVASFRIRRAKLGESDWVLVGTLPGEAAMGPREYLFRDRPPGPGTFVYRVNPVLMTGQEEVGPVAQVTVSRLSAGVLAIERIMPDPLASGRVSTITFSVPGTGSQLVGTKLDVLDVQGRIVRTLVDDRRPAGVHTTYWDGRDEAARRLPSGLYLVRLEAHGRKAGARVLLVR